MSAVSKRCMVAWAAPGHELLIEVEVAEEATIAQVLEAARRISGDESIPWTSAPTGIFGEPYPRSARPRDGDRVELYRTLRIDPKAARRSRARPRGGG
jgi:putative ubiquitin-RnfH superfamily antitoxin RatB of RatAB toxin-antitoxin module